VRKQLALLAVIGLSAAVLAVFGLPSLRSADAEDRLLAYRWNDPELETVSGPVQVLDDADQARYIGEVDAGSYTGRGKVFDKAGELLYDGPLVDGVYEGPDAKVYRDGVLVYTGEMVGNLYEGQGRRINPETGIVSEGQFSKGLLEGQGQEFYDSGALLREGTFSRDLLEGEGCEYSVDGVLLREGTFSQGLLHGEGREYTASGKLRYEGQFWRGIYHGEGTLYDTLLGARSAAGTFVYGRLSGQGTIYHPSGQLLYTGQVCGERPKADAFLGLSLSDVEQAFTSHWLLYSSGDVTAFVYPYFKLMFITESRIDLVSPTQMAEESERERQELMQALERPAAEGTGAAGPEGAGDQKAPEDAAQPDVTEDTSEPENVHGQGDASEPEDTSGQESTPEPEDALRQEAAAAGSAARMASVVFAAPLSEETSMPPLYSDELLSEDTDKQAVIITQVLSYRDTLPCAAQPNYDFVSGRHRPGWREWFSDFAAGELVEGASVRQSGQFIWRFTPWPDSEAAGCINEFLAEHAGVETMTVRKEDKDMSLWYQTARWKDGP